MTNQELLNWIQKEATSQDLINVALSWCMGDDCRVFKMADFNNACWNGDMEPIEVVRWIAKDFNPDDEYCMENQENKLISLNESQVIQIVRQCAPHHIDEIKSQLNG